MRSELQSAFGRTAARIAVAEEMPVGAGLMVELEAITALPMDAYLAVQVQALWGKLESHLAARRMIATSDTVHRLHGRLDLSLGNARMLAAQEIACATHIPYPTAITDVALVERVADCLPKSWEALDRGDITLSHLKSVERATHNCTARVTVAVDAQVIPLAIDREWTPSEIAKAARKLILALDPEGAKRRAAAAKNEADVQFYPDNDGMASLVAHGPADKAQQIMTAINQHADAMVRSGDARPVGVRRFDALYDLVYGGAAMANGTGIARRVETRLNLDLATYLGLNDQPGELVGYGPITAEAARRIAADSTLRRLITDPLTGKALDLGLKAYRPSAALARLVEAEHPTCGMPGCGRSADTCQIDHRKERHDSGRTDEDNLGPLCLMHHQMKTKKLWKLDVGPEGTEKWTSYLGYTYTKKPAWFPLPEPLSPEDERGDTLAAILDRLPDFDPDPPYPDEPLAEPPPLTDEQYQEMAFAVDNLHAFGDNFRDWCNRHYDEARRTGLVA
jgi:hypothetical protein